jgi:hypothetical protein
MATRKPPVLCDAIAQVHLWECCSYRANDDWRFTRGAQFAVITDPLEIRAELERQLAAKGSSKPALLADHCGQQVRHDVAGHEPHGPRCASELSKVFSLGSFVASSALPRASTRASGPSP